MKFISKYFQAKLNCHLLQSHRTRLAKRYLTGAGLEIGAMHNPLLLPRTCSVKYLDISSRDESIRKFPELNPNEIVEVDYLTDGFSLAGIPAAQFDFLVANHVLEHSPNLIGTLIRWIEVVKQSGKIFLSVPLASRCFDRGRALTTYDHVLIDFDAYRENRLEEIDKRNRKHYLEWLTISEPNILKRKPVSGVSLETRVDELVRNKTEIHFHTFSKESIEIMFRNIESELLPSIRLLETYAGMNEVVVVLQKTASLI